MARYVDGDALIKWAREKSFTQDVEGKVLCFDFETAVRNHEVVDVVPKSELVELEAKIKVLKKDRYQVFPDGHIELIPRTDIDAINREVASDIFKRIYRKLEYYERDRELNDIINNFFVFIEEAEKEYTEVEDLE